MDNEKIQIAQIVAECKSVMDAIENMTWLQARKSNFRIRYEVRTQYGNSLYDETISKLVLGENPGSPAISRWPESISREITEYAYWKACAKELCDKIKHWREIEIVAMKMIKISEPEIIAERKSEFLRLDRQIQNEIQERVFQNVSIHKMQIKSNGKFLSQADTAEMLSQIANESCLKVLREQADSCLNGEWKQ